MTYQTVEKIREELRVCPSLGPLLLVGLGVMGGVCGFGWRGWLGLVHASFWVSCLHGGRRWWMSLMLFVFGSWWGLRAVRTPSDSYICLMGREECRVHCRGMVTGCPLPGGPFDFAVYGIKTVDGWKKCSGLVRLRVKESFTYGDNLEVTGGMIYPEAGFQRRHLRTLGMCHELECETVELLAHASGWRKAWAYCLNLRGKLSDGLTEGFRSSRLGGLYLAMSMGRRDLFPQAERESFVKSATIHVFAISGLHVNCLMLATCLMLRTTFLGKRTTRLIALPVIVLYVLLTGPGPSSLRAVLMLCGGTLALCMLRRGNDRHVLCLSALLLLLLNPLYLLHIGFQFSFLIVGVLVYCRPMQRGMKSVMTERWRWRLRTEGRMTMFRGVKRILGAMASCCLAWVGCLALTLHVNRLMPLGALAVNLVVQPLAAMMVEGAVPKIMLSCIWKRASCWMGHILEIAMDYAVKLAEWGAQDELCREGVGIPFERACVYILLFAILFTRHIGKVLKMGMIGGMVVIIAAGLWERQEKASGLMLFRASSGSRACLVMLDRGWGSAFVLVPGCGESAKVAAQWLKRNGVTTVEDLFTVGGVMRKGAQEWMRRMFVRSVVADDEWRRSWEMSRLAASGIHLGHWHVKTNIGYEYRHGGRIWRMSDGHGETGLRYDDGNGGMSIYYNETEDGLALLSFIGSDYAGNVVLKPGLPDRNVYLSFK
ncbi:MAG: ComEC/Rec2 family competence protein [Victivallales bacterium]|nr:ComEC/Rec2 family competence protein [Victivallales bacterium]